MYFTRFPINKTRHETRRLLSSPYMLHAAIAGSFPPGSCESADESAGRVLWRIDTLEAGKDFLYIVSPEEPSLVGLDEQIGWPDKPAQWESRDYEPFLKQIAKGQEYSFRLVANPVLSRKGIENEQGHTKRIGHLTVLQQAAWLIGKSAYSGTQTVAPELFERQEQSRAERNGFIIPVDPNTGIAKLIVSNSRKLTFKKGKSGKSITLVMARYDGVLQVTDAGKLCSALSCGIGHAKGFGCGLLTLASLRSKHEEHAGD